MRPHAYSPIVMPEPIELLPGERLVAVREVDLVDPPSLPDALGELCKLTGVERPEEIGENGPAIGGRVTEANADEPAMRLFEVVFGRDSLMTAFFVEQLFPRLLEATVLYLAETQGTVYDARREEEPGRIVHEIREDDPDGVWGFPYYGSVDATVHYIRGALRVVARRPELRAELQPALDAALAWLLRRLGEDKLGLLSFRRANPHGLENQVWKDSFDSMSHADGTVCNHAAPVASLEAQAIAYDALIEAGAADAAARLERAIEQHFWIDDGEGGFYAIGVDRDPATGAPRPLETRASNMGWLLGSRLLDGREDRRRRIVDLLFSDELLADAGIRTLSSREVRFRARSYHNGTVWPHDNYTIVLGLDRCGFVDEAQELRRRLLMTCAATHRYPEFVAGTGGGADPVTRRIVDVYDDVNDRPNRLEQPPQEIIAWTVAAAVAIEHG
jgi:glycogen debranching enzyme